MIKVKFAVSVVFITFIFVYIFFNKVPLVISLLLIAVSFFIALALNASETFNEMMDKRFKDFEKLKKSDKIIYSFRTFLVIALYFLLSRTISKIPETVIAEQINSSFFLFPLFVSLILLCIGKLFKRLENDSFTEPVNSADPKGRAAD